MSSPNQAIGEPLQTSDHYTKVLQYGVQIKVTAVIPVGGMNRHKR